MRHHFQDDTRGFGLLAPYWDRVFGTATQRRTQTSSPGRPRPGSISGRSGKGFEIDDPTVGQLAHRALTSGRQIERPQPVAVGPVEAVTDLGLAVGTKERVDPDQSQIAVVEATLSALPKQQSVGRQPVSRWPRRSRSQDDDRRLLG